MDWEDVCSNEYPTSTTKYFDCLGDVNSYEERNFHQNSFIAGREIETISCSRKYSAYIGNTKSIELFNYKFDLGTAFTSHCAPVFNLARKNLLLLDQICLNAGYLKGNVISDRLNYYELRIQITELLYYSRVFLKQILGQSSEIIYCCKELEEKNAALRLSLKSFSNLPNYVISHSISNRGNQCTQAIYHLFHGHLEWRWHHLLFIFELMEYQNLCSNQRDNEINVMELTGSIPLVNTLFEDYLKLFLGDLITIAIEIFEKTQISDILNVTPFSCWCVRECWLLLQLLVEKLSLQGKLKSFWNYFNEIVRHVNKTDSQEIQRNDCSKLILNQSYKCSNITAFSIWLLVNVAKLHGYDKEGIFIGFSSERVSSNYELLVSVLKSCITGDGLLTEQYLRIYIKLISEILTKWWEQKNDILTLLWEYFQKRLNSTFFIQGSAPDTMAVCSKSAVGLVRIVKQRLSTSPTQMHESSYNNFLYLLGKHFSRCRENGENTYWQKFKGRVYPKFTQNKLLALSEMGLLNFASLFLTLAISVDVKEIGMKLEDLLSQLPPEKIDNSCKAMIMKTHLALIILSVENKLDIAYATKALLDIVNSSSAGLSKDNNNSLIQIFIEGFRDIVEISQDFQLSEHLLIDIWLPKYLYTCSQNDQSKLLDILITALSKLQILYQQDFCIGIQKNILETDELSNRFIKVSEKLWLHVLPFLRQNATSSNSISQVADMAVHFTLFSLYDRTLCLNFDQNFSILFKYFSQNENVNIRITRRYLCKILIEKDAIYHLRSQIPKFESLVIQSWIKCSILCYEDFQNQEMKEMFSIISEYEEVKQLFNSCSISVVESDDALCAMFNVMGHCYNNADTFQEKCRIRELLNSYLCLLEKHVIPLIKNPTSLDLTIRVYSVISILFLHCAPLMYIRSKSTCLLHVLLTQLILPPALFMDKKPHPYVISAMRKTWHLYVKGLYKLDHKTDPYIEKTLKDLIVVYVPFFATKSNMIEKFSSVQPLQKLLCMEDSQDSLLSYVFEKISSNFLICRGKQVNQNSAMVLMLLLEIIQKSRNDTRIMKFFIVGLNTALLEQVMFLEDLSLSRKAAYEIVETIVGTIIFKSNNELQKEFSNSITTLSQKHLAFSANYLFRLLQTLADIIPSVVEQSLPSIRNHVACVEARRGVGHDEGLRSSLRKLELYIQKMSSNTFS